MSKKYPTIFTRDYVSDWTPANALREICQNCLDDASTFEYDLSGDTIIFTSKGVKLHQSTLLLGNSSKREDATTVGGKGEGYKLACVILLREGHDITIRNGDLIWTPQFEYSDLFEAEVMVFVETSGNGNDLSFEISGATEDLVSEVKEDCLYLQSDLGEVKEGTAGRILTDIAGKLYVGGLYVCNINGHKYSYDFKPEYLPLNRDRKSVDSWDLARNTTKLLEEVFPAKEVAVMVRDKVRDTGSLFARIKNQDVAEAAYELFKEVSPALTVVCDGYDEQNKLKDRGFKNVEVVYDNNYRQLIQQSVEYQDMVTELEEVLDAPEEEDTRTPIEVLLDCHSHILNTNCIANESRVLMQELVDLFKEKGVEWQ